MTTVMVTIAVVLGLHTLSCLTRAFHLGRTRKYTAREAEDQVKAACNASISVIVPAWNDADVLTRTLTALKSEIDDARTRVQVFIVAGGGDHSFETAAAFVEERSFDAAEWMVLRQEPRGKNAALNQALALLQDDIMIFLDADTEVQKGWLTGLTEPIIRRRAVAVTGTFVPYQRTLVSRLFELDQLIAQVISREVNLFGGGTIAIHRCALVALGGRLPEHVLVGVDWDLSELVKAKGFPVAYAESACVRTEIAETWREFLRNETRWKRAYLVATWRHLKQDRAWRRLVGLLYVPFVHGFILSGWILLPAAMYLFGYPLNLGLYLWLSFTAWILLRHSGNCFKAYAYDGDPAWLRLIPTYIAGFVASSVATWRAVLSLSKLSPHFKGQRTNTTES